MIDRTENTLTLQQAWDGSFPGDPGSPKLWERPILRARIVITLEGCKMHPFRVATDGKCFRLDVQMNDGRTLRLFLPPDCPCEDWPVQKPYPRTPDTSILAKRFGFAARDYTRARLERVELDLTGRGLEEEKPTEPSTCQESD